MRSAYALGSIIVLVGMLGVRADAQHACPEGTRAVASACVRAPASAITIDGGALPPPPAPRTRRGPRPHVTAIVPSAIVEPFVLDAYEVTWPDYMACVGADVCPPIDLPTVWDARRRTAHDRIGAIGVVEGRPIRGVALAGARTYCAHVGGRLPSTEEWTLAARGTTGRTYPWGEHAPDATRVAYGAVLRAGFVFDPGVIGTHTLDVTPLGVHDLAGSVREWVEDTHAAAGYGVVRGGSFLETDVARLEGVESVTVPVTLQVIDVGFRCAYGANVQ